MEGSIYSNRKSGIPKPTKFRSSQCTSPVENGNSSFLYGSVNHLPGTLTKSNSSSPSPTEEMSRSRWNLSSRSTDYLQKIVELERQNQKISDENIKFKGQIAQLGSQLSDTKGLYEKELMTRKTSEAIQNEQKQIIKTLKANVTKRDTEFQHLMEKNGKIRKKLGELLPEENFFDESDHIDHNGTLESTEPAIADCMEKMVNEIGKLKAYISKMELQLYETDEKISDLMENKLQMEKENAALKVENANMTTLAKLVTENMQESLDTSKKMEYTIRQMRAEKDKLLKGSQRDIPDMVYPPPRKSLPQNNIVQIRPEPERPIPVPPKRITEMHDSKVAGEGDGGNVEECVDELPGDVIERIRMLEIKLEMAERELTFALNRAEEAETALEELKKKESNTMPPPPPPPIPPPLPPPLTMTNTPRVNTVVKIKSLRDGVIERNDSRVAKAPASNQNLGQSTGMDALISELNNGTVTLRRRRPPDTRNPALKELFETLEEVQKQNRSSKTLIGFNLKSMTRTTSEHF
uniref:Putative wasp-related protein n=1 Tax=Nyssomyia neivai TaxID=330878 RepID=A0A1L8DCB7_9DIPT